jgi:hypothetical protein
MAILQQGLLQTTDLNRKIAELEMRLAKLESALKVGAAGDVTLRAASKMTIESAAVMELKSALIKLN